MSHTSFLTALRRLLEAQSVSFPQSTMRSQHALLQLLQVSRLSAIRIKHRALSLSLGGARSSGVVLLAFCVGFLRGGGGGSHDWNVGDTGKVRNGKCALQSESTGRKHAGFDCKGNDGGMKEKEIQLRCRGIDAGGSRPNPVSGPHRMSHSTKTTQRHLYDSIRLIYLGSHL